MASLIACRLVLGIGEAFCYPVNAKVTSLWFRRSERGLATGIWASGSRVGSAMTLPLVAFIIANFGWREAFLVTGVIGIVWMVLWYILYRDPKNHSAVSAEQLAVLEADYAVKAGRQEDRLRRTVSLPDDLGDDDRVLLPEFRHLLLHHVVPFYLTQSRGFSLAKLGTLGLVPGLVAIPAGRLRRLPLRPPVQGWLEPHRRPEDLPRRRPLASSVVALAPLVSGDAAALTLLAISYSGLAFAGANIWTLPGDVAPDPDPGPRRLGSPAFRTSPRTWQALPSRPSLA